MVESGWKTASIVLTVLIVTVIVLVIVWLLFRYLNNNRKIKNTILKNEDIKMLFDKNQEKFAEAVDDYFKETVIGTVDVHLMFKYLSVDMHKKKNDARDVAWDFFTLLTTSVVANESKGKVSEAVDSIYHVFKEGQKMLLRLDKYNIVANVILKILNLKLRPILTKTRSFPLVMVNGKYLVDDSRLEEADKEAFWKSIEELRDSLINDRYLEFMALASSSTLDTKAIAELINYSKPIKESARDRKNKKTINETVMDDSKSLGGED